MSFRKIINNVLSFPRKVMYKIVFGNKIKGIFNLNSYAPFYLSSKSNGKIKFAKNITSRGFLSVRVARGAQIEIGANCFFNYNVSITALSGIKIGDNCKFGNNVVFVDHDHSTFKNIESASSDGFVCQDIVIGNNVWIGANCAVLRGTHIGDNSVVAAGSVIKGSFGPNSIIHNNSLVKGD